MTNLSTLKEIISDGDVLLGQKENLVERSLVKELLNRRKYGVVEVATGVRRSGKSTILLWIGRLLKAKGDRVYYINFEDDRIFYENKDFEKISSIIDLTDTVLLIDEPQNMPKWEKWVRRLHDRKVKVYLTGSNSKLLGTELASSLGGRKKQHEVFPFSFSEFLFAKGKMEIPVDQEVRLFEEYMTNGGYPYPIISKDYSILSDYRNDIIERDIIMRHRIREIGEFRNLMRFVMSHPGIYLSAKSIRGFLDISHVTLRKYLEFLIEAYAVIPLNKFSYSQKERILNPKKIYPIDNGLLTEKNQMGKILESVIVQHLRRKIPEIFYWKDERGREVDIYLPDRKLAIQVVYSLTQSNLEREERSLESARKKFKAKSMIVYLHSEVESKFPSVRATDFLEDIDRMISGSNRKKRKK
jgi:predicted AAA+ superfamily ATPase